jgi:hypothetical protein
MTPSAAESVPTADPRLSPDRWQDWPVVPAISARSVEIYKSGVQAGRNPKAFSKIGDCESITEWFLADFDKGPSYYNLGPYSDLQTVIDIYQGSFRRLGQAAKPGFTTASLLTPIWADRTKCNKNESPLDCEIRNNNPALVLITIGTNDANRPETFEPNMRKVLDLLIQDHILPVLATKADNVEKDNRINATIARLAYEYDIPLWNFWSAVQSLPDSGLQPDGAHLTWSPNDFSNSDNLERAWPVRNLTALQVLDAIRQATEK